MADLVYTTGPRIVALAGQLAVDLRTDDADAADLLAQAADYASGEIDWYCGDRYGQAELAKSRWVANAADFVAVMWLCTHRLNEVPGSIQKRWEDDLRPKLEAVQAGKAGVPFAAASRRPITVTNSHVDLRRVNKQVRVDRSRSTGLAEGYSRPTDPTAGTGEG